MASTIEVPERARSLSSIERGESNITVDVLERFAILLNVQLSPLSELIDRGQADDAETGRRASDPADHSADARVAIEAIEEAAGRTEDVESYSRAARPLRR